MMMIVMPVYNEQASVRKVVMEWFQEVENWTEDFVFLAINDGSKDGTLAILRRLREQLGPRLEIIDRPIRFRERYGGEPSVTLGKFGAKAWELIKQISRLQPAR